MRTIITLLLFSLNTLIYSQDLITLKSYYYNTNQVEKVYQVLKKKTRIKHGTYVVLNNDSTLNTSGWYKMNNKDSLWKFYSPPGVVMIEGNYKNNRKHGQWNYFRENGVLESTGNFIKDLEEGHWLFYNETGNLICEGNYKAGKEVENSFVHFDKSGVIIDSLITVNDPINYPKSRTIEDLLETEYGNVYYSHFRIGEEALSSHIQNTLRITNSIRMSDLYGNAVVIIKVKPSGRIEIVKFLGSFSNSYDKELQRVLLSMPRWIPATKDGNPVNSIYVLPYSYSQHMRNPN
ncbi:MAG: hypothetical protein Q7J34_07425 [Bacteroidales bacterium]|nr:hypothetical protein [Bacteroidales bacterium]